MPLSRRFPRLVERGRHALRAAAHRAGARRVMQRIVHELQEAMRDDFYDGSYFGSDRNPYDRMDLSGYERYDRDTSNANVAAYIVWRFFDVSTTLDAGCATGFVVEALRELGLEAQGTDISQWAVDNATPGARGHVLWGDLLHKLPVKDAAFDLVTALETLEHLPPESVPRALRELRRVTGRYLVATIPSFGPNEHGPGGWFQHKVRHELVEQYNALGPDYDGPIPHDDLLRDVNGKPIEGHLTIASFRWWTRQFEEAGFVRCGATERSIHPHLARFGLTKYWNLYVFRTPDVPEPVEVRGSEEIAEVERRFGLDNRTASPEDIEAVEAAIGPLA